MRQPLDSAQEFGGAGHRYADVVHDGDDHEPEHYAR